VGAVGLWTGRHVYFDNGGKYPKNSIEGLMERTDYWERRNSFLEELAYRACLEETEEENQKNFRDGINSSDNYIANADTNVSAISDTFQDTDTPHATQLDSDENQQGTLTISVVPQFSYTVTAHQAFSQQVNTVNATATDTNITGKINAQADSATGHIGVTTNELECEKNQKQVLKQMLSRR
jgi:hypothetical protein